MHSSHDGSLLALDGHQPSGLQEGEGTGHRLRRVAVCEVDENYQKQESPNKYSEEHSLSPLFQVWFHGRPRGPAPRGPTAVGGRRNLKNNQELQLVHLGHLVGYFWGPPSMGRVWGGWEGASETRVVISGIAKSRHHVDPSLAS
jgi:hypothetical protein